MQLSVILPTHNPDIGRLRRTLNGLWAQTLPHTSWETLLVDNASHPAVDLAPSIEAAPPNFRLVHEPHLGLTAARQRGFREARGEILVLVDDDNVLAPDYLERVLALFAAYPRVGALGGSSVPEFAVAPPPWVREFYDLLACRDLGPATQISRGLLNPHTGRNEYPAFAPIGAGMALRRAAMHAWLDDRSSTTLTDRRGGELSSGGDNDIVLTVLGAGWEIVYSPALTLTHLIPASRLERDYLARLKRGIAKSWVQVLHKHRANPWTPIALWTVPPRKIKAWFSYKAWSSPAAFVRWQGACGHFEGLAALTRLSS